MAWYAHISERGPIKWNVLPSAISILERPDNFQAVGIAFSNGWIEGDGRREEE